MARKIALINGIPRMQDEAAADSITALVGDVTAAGPGTAAATITSEVDLHSPIIHTLLNMSNQAEIRFREQTSNGTNYISLKAPSNLSSILSLTLPESDGNTGELLTTDGSGNLGWVSSLSNPMTNENDIIIGGTGGAATRLASSDNGVLRRVGSGTLEFGTIIENNIADNAVTTAKINNGAVNSDKLANNLTISGNTALTVESSFTGTGNAFSVTTGNPNQEFRIRGDGSVFVESAASGSTPCLDLYEPTTNNNNSILRVRSNNGGTGNTVFEVESSGSIYASDGAFVVTNSGQLRTTGYARISGTSSASSTVTGFYRHTSEALRVAVNGGFRAEFPPSGGPWFAGMPEINKGAIVASGSNSDGQWTRFGDGTQICRARALAICTSDTFVTTDFSWPINFSASPRCMGQSDSNVYGPTSTLRVWYISNSSSSGYTVRTFRTNNTNTNGDILAIGSW